MKKSLLILGAIVLTAPAAMADSMVIEMVQAGADNVEIPMSGLQKLTFTDGNLNVYGTGDAAQVFAMGDIERIYFSVEGGVSEVFTNADTAVLLHAPGTDNVAIRGIEAATVLIYDEAGRLMLTAADAGDIDVSSLTNGKLYIAVAGNFSAKFIK